MHTATTEDQDKPAGSPDWAGRVRRYVPLIVYGMAVLAILAIPLQIISHGYLPRDDALRHAAKAVSGKSWPEILVVGDQYKIDYQFGWHLVLTKLHRWFGCDAEALVIIAVVGLFLVLGWSVTAWLRRPEAWLGTLLVMSVSAGTTGRLFLGRPFLLTMSVLMAILLAWHFSQSARPGWRAVAGLTGLIWAATFVHGVWYLWALPVMAFFLARQYRWAIALTTSWVLGTLLAAVCTGQPGTYLTHAVLVAFKSIGMHDTQRTLVTELQAGNGDFPMLVVLGGIVLLRRLGGHTVRPLSTNPALWLTVIGWVLGFKAVRFWQDWGWPALMVLATTETQAFLQAAMPSQAIKRIPLAGGLALAAFLAISSDSGARWTYNLTWQYLKQDDPELAGWLPESGGILYSSEMTVFYQTFFRNPHAPWRYILGFEATIMPEEDFGTFHSILWNFGDAKAYRPWVRKMRPEDRLAFRSESGSRPPFPEIEWHYAITGLWLGRVPKTNAPPPAASP
jgi:hypothetical protein